MDDKITVCSKCLRASCWLGLLSCDDSTSAGTVEMTREELEKLNLEPPVYWEKENAEVIREDGIGFLDAIDLP